MRKPLTRLVEHWITQPPPQRDFSPSSRKMSAASVLESKIQTSLAGFPTRSISIGSDPFLSNHFACDHPSFNHTSSMNGLKEKKKTPKDRFLQCLRGLPGR